MQHTKVPASIRLAAAVVGIALTAGACGTSSAVESTADAAPATTVDTVPPETVPAPAADPAPSTTSPAPVPVAPSEPAAPSAPPATESPDEPDPPVEQPPGDQPPVEPADVPEAAEPAGPCGDFGPIPPVPDSMPTLTFDTDGDGAADDAVTAYGAADGWRVRVVEDGVTSEALVGGIAGWAYLAAPVVTAAGDRLVLVDVGAGRTWQFETDDQRCVQALHEPIDDLVVVPVEPEPPVLIDDFRIGDEAPGCGGLAPIPADALISTEHWRDIDDDGFAEERIVAYFDGTWKLRGEVPEAGLASEIEIPGAGPHGVRVLGFADVDLTYGGEEIIAVVGGGAYAVEVGVFSFLEGYCIFRYQSDGGGDFGVLSGASVIFGEGVVCGDGHIVDWGYQREADDTYTVWSAAYEPVSLGVFGIMAASDDFAEGLSFDDIDDDLFVCDGMSL